MKKSTNARLSENNEKEYAGAESASLAQVNHDVSRKKKSKSKNSEVVNGGAARNAFKKETLKINEAFAERYQDSTRKKLLANVPAVLLEDSSDSSSSEEEDEFGELLTKGIDRRVQETLDAIRNKDSRIYDGKSHFFDSHPPATDDKKNEPVDDSDDGDAEVNSDDEPVAGWDTIANAHNADAPKMTLKDYVRETLLKDGKLSDSEDQNEDYGEQSERWRNDKISPEDTELAAGSLVTQTRKTGKLLERDSDESGSSDANDTDDDDMDFFQKKVKSKEEWDAEEKDFEQFLVKQTRKNSQKSGEELLLHAYLENEKPDEKERFLRDFVLNNGWLDKNASEAPEAGDYEIEIDTVDPDAEEDGDGAGDEFDDRVDEFEAKYNFRFEDPDGTQVISHARNVPESMRRPDDRRKRAREARKLRKDREKAAKTDDIRRLKNLKKKDIQARLLAIQEAAGDGVDVTGIDLDGDFDPDEFNRQMESKFGDDYYSQKDAEMKQLTKEGAVVASEKRLPSKQPEDTPPDIREDVNKMMDEYYNLDYEDIVGGVPMRFNYKKVEPQSFNLNSEDILSMEDKELNRLVSLKYLAPYRSNRDIKKQSWRVHDALKKKRHAEAAAAAASEVATPDEGYPDNLNRQTSKKLKNKKRRRAQENAGEVARPGFQNYVTKEQQREMDPDQSVETVQTKSAKRKHKKKNVRFEDEAGDDEEHNCDTDMGGVTHPASEKREPGIPDDDVMKKNSRGKKKKRKRNASKSEILEGLSAARKGAYSIQ